MSKTDWLFASYLFLLLALLFSVLGYARCFAFTYWPGLVLLLVATFKKGKL